jgi:hypothetical protein
VTVDGRTVGGNVYDSPIGLSEVVSIQKNGNPVSMAPADSKTPTSTTPVRDLIA